jgi:hypothetical protein
VGLFFYGRSSGPWLADTVGRSASEVGIEFLTAAADGIHMQACNAGDKNIAAVPDPLGLQSSQPAALLFIKAVEKEIQLAMQGAFGRIFTANTSGALTLMNGEVVHDRVSVECPSGLENDSVRKTWTPTTGSN